MRNRPRASDQFFIEIPALENAVAALSLRGMILLKFDSAKNATLIKELIHFHPETANLVANQYDFEDIIRNYHKKYDGGEVYNEELNWVASDLKSADQPQEVLNALLGVLASNEAGNLACIYVKDSGIFLETEKNYLLGIMELAAVTLKLKSAIELLTNEKIKYDNLFYASPEAIAMLDAQNRVLDVNPAFERLFQYKKHELEGLVPEDVISENRNSPQSNIAPDLKNQNTVIADEFVRRRRDGKRINVAVINVPVDFGNGQCYNFRFYHEVIRENPESSERSSPIGAPLQASLISNKYSDSFKSTFLSGISHEMRTPMNHILGFLDLLSEPDITASEKEDFMKIMKSSGMKLLHLIDDVIELGLIDSGQVAIKEDKFNLNRLMVSLFEEAKKLAATLPETLVNLKLNIDNNLDNHTLISDEVRIKQIMINLISNALKFTREGEVEIGYQISGSKTITFYVKDTGIGINPEDQKLIFERFKKLENSLTTSNAGVGLGLSICQGLASMFNSKISIESLPGHGSTFRFSIPLVIFRAPVKVKPPLVTPGHQFDWSGKTVLIVEDDPVNTHFLKILLSKTKISLLFASDGRQAIEMVQNHPVDVVLMDMNLPVMNGYESTRKIKKLRPDLPVIAQTAHAMRGDRNECLAAGCDEYLSKPIDMNHLYALVDNFLRKENH